jgi:3-deoxy-D-manno-octulosonate 8-phosphate phosphatase (KDO 8-P phosphatase)
MKNKSYKENLNHIKTFIFDVDGVLTDGNIMVTTEGEMYRSVNTKDGYAIKLALSKGFKVVIISGGINKGIEKRFRLLGLSDVYLGSENKLEALQDLTDNYNLNLHEILYMGDDIPDIPVMEKVGVSCCPADAVIDVKRISNYISCIEGGKGCVREIIEQTLRVQDKWIIDFKSIIE